MKAGSLLFILLCFFLNIQAQDHSQYAKSLLLKSTAKSKNNTKSNDVNLRLTHQHKSTLSGATYYQFIQTTNGIDVQGTDSKVVLDGDGKVVQLSNKIMSKLPKGTLKSSASYDHSVALSSYYKRDVKALKSMSQDNTLRLENQTADIHWDLVYLKRNDVWVLAYSYILEDNKGHLQQIFIDSKTHELIDAIPFAHSCQFHHEHSDEKRYDSSLNGSTNNEKNTTETTSADSYLAFAYPLQSPLDGGQSLVSSPWLSFPDASPYGWHDLNGQKGAEMYTTYGNNVKVGTDKNGDDVHDTDTNTSEKRSLTNTYSDEMAPEENEAASLTNIFYWMNLLHDTYYRFGFTESAGNFQMNNYGRGGAAGDMLIVDALDGSGQNNAYFSTPPDGFIPKMETFLWSTTRKSPSITVGTTTMVASKATFGPSELKSTLIGHGIVTTPLDACTPIDNANELIGKIAVIQRGSCIYTDKVMHAQNAGAIAAIICNNVDGSSIQMSGSDDRITIPSAMISKSDCEELIIGINNEQTIEMSLPQSKVMDAGFDNTILVHEYTHGLSTRLVGGAANSSCLTNAEQMGEGWSDFYAVLLTQKDSLTESTVRGVGSYVLGSNDPNATIRPYLYTYDMSVNPVTYGDLMSLGKPHGVGFVWASILWDMAVQFVDAYGFDQDLYSGEGGNIELLKIVTEAMKLTSCQPGFIDARDALLEADMLINGGENHCMMWDVFARRGLGSHASQGASQSIGDEIVDFTSPGSCRFDVTIDKTADKKVYRHGQQAQININILNNNLHSQKLVRVVSSVGSGIYIPTEEVKNSQRSSAQSVVYENKDFYTVESDSFSFVAEIFQTDEYLIAYDSAEDEQSFRSTAILGKATFLKSNATSSEGDIAYFVNNYKNEDVLSYFTSEEMVLDNNPFFAFTHQYDFEDGWDGAYLEISADGGASFEVIPSELFISNPYNSSLRVSTNSEIGGKEAFSGSSAGFVQSVVDLRTFAGQNVMIRFAFGTDISTNGDGWFIDEIQMVNAEPIILENTVTIDGKEGQHLIDEIVVLPVINQTAYLVTCMEEMSHNYGQEAIACETCDDGLLNGDEEEVDCGGALCAPCFCDLQPLDQSDLNIKVFLEGGLIKNALFGEESQEMSSLLLEHGYLPGNIPSSVFGQQVPNGHHYDNDIYQYHGLEGSYEDFGTTCYTDSVIDWVLVELRADLEMESRVVRFAALLHSDGQLQFFNSTAPQLLDGDEYYIAIYHRNSLPALSDKVTVTNGQLFYDFTQNEGYSTVFSHNQKLMASGSYALFSGNTNQVDSNFSDINAVDLHEFRKDFGKHDSYLNSDFNFDSDVNANDKTFLQANAGISVFVTN